SRYLLPVREVTVREVNSGAMFTRKIGVLAIAIMQIKVRAYNRLNSAYRYMKSDCNEISAHL
ncbi:MAG: hypothetical protein ACRC9M_09125, partial [Aeromonas sp.]